MNLAGFPSFKREQSSNLETNLAAVEPKLENYGHFLFGEPLSGTTATRILPLIEKCSGFPAPQSVNKFEYPDEIPAKRQKLNEPCPSNTDLNVGVGMALIKSDLSDEAAFLDLVKQANETFHVPMLGELQIGAKNPPPIKSENSVSNSAEVPTSPICILSGFDACPTLSVASTSGVVESKNIERISVPDESIVEAAQQVADQCESNVQPIENSARSTSDDEANKNDRFSNWEKSIPAAAQKPLQRPLLCSLSGNDQSTSSITFSSAGESKTIGNAFKPEESIEKAARRVAGQIRLDKIRSTLIDNTNQKQNEKIEKDYGKKSMEIEITFPNDIMLPNYCKICEAPFNNPMSAKSHYDGKRHHLKETQYIRKIYNEKSNDIARIVSNEEKRKQPSDKKKRESDAVIEKSHYWCAVCDASFKRKTDYDFHVASAVHFRNLEGMFSDSSYDTKFTAPPVVRNITLPPPAARNFTLTPVTRYFTPTTVAKNFSPTPVARNFTPMLVARHFTPTTSTARNVKPMPVANRLEFEKLLHPRRDAFAINVFYCNLCGKSMNSHQQLANHIASKKHQNKEKTNAELINLIKTHKVGVLF